MCDIKECSLSPADLWSALRSVGSGQVDRTVHIQLALASIAARELAQRSGHGSTLSVALPTSSARDGQELSALSSLACARLTLDRAVELA